MHAGTHFTDPGRMESRVNFSGKDVAQVFNPRPGRGSKRSETSGLADRESDLTTTPTPPLIKYTRKLVKTNQERGERTQTMLQQQFFWLQLPNYYQYDWH